MRKRVRIRLPAFPAVLCLLVATMAGLVSAETPVAGTIETDTRWTVEGSPYVLGDRVIILSNATLSVEPGVVVEGRDQVSPRVEHNGFLSTDRYALRLSPTTSRSWTRATTTGAPPSAPSSSR